MKEYNYIISGKKYCVAVNESIDGVTQVVVNGEVFNVATVREEKEDRHAVTSVAEVSAIDDSHSEPLTAPISGVVKKVLVAAGQVVREGDELLILEAMKMNNALTAEHDGVVKEILVTPGTTVHQDTILITFV